MSPNNYSTIQSKTNFELLRALFVFRLCAFDTLVRHNQRVLAASRRLLGERLFHLALRATFFGHFVAGETQEEVADVTAKLTRFGVKSILDYSVESDVPGGQAAQEEKQVLKELTGDCQGERKAGEAQPKVESAEDAKFPIDPTTIDKTHQQYSAHQAFSDRRMDVVSARTYFYSGEQECDKNMQTFCDCIDAMAQRTSGQGFIAIKLTALGRPQLLLRLSETIAQTQNFFKAITGSTWETLVMSKISEGDFLRRLEEFGIKTDSELVREWFKIVDFDEDGFVDFYDWGRLLDVGGSSGGGGVSSSMFQVLNIKSGKLEPLIKDLSKAEEVEVGEVEEGRKL